MTVVPKREGFIEEKPKAAAPPPEIEPSPVELPALPADQWPMVIKLVHKPIRDNQGNEIKELTLREPRAGDISRYGLPVRVNNDAEIIIDERKMTYVIATLSGILPPLIEAMDPRDWTSCAYYLRRFFIPEPAAWAA